MSSGIFSYAVGISIAGLFAVFVMGMTWRNPPRLFALFLVAILFERTAEHLSGLGAVSFLDEGLLGLVVLRAATWRQLTPRRLMPTTAFLAGFAACGLASGIALGTSVAVLTSGTVLACKALLACWSAARFDWNDSDIQLLMRVGGYVAIFVLVGVGLNLALGGAWVRIFSVNGEPIERYGLSSLLSFFIHPFDLAFVAAMCAIGFTAQHAVWRPSTKSRLAIFLLATAVVLSFRRKDVVGLIAGAFIAGSRRSRVTGAVALGIALTVLGATVLPTIENNVSEFRTQYFSADSTEARTVLTRGAFKVASDYFPGGAGFGRYASRTAAVDYSPEYLRLGISRIYGLGPGDQGVFLTDTSWPAILGETGYIGLGFFLAAIAAMWVQFRRGRKSAASLEVEWLNYFGAGLLVLVLFESLGAPVFSSPPVYPFIFTFAGISWSVSRRLRPKTDEEKHVAHGTGS